MPRGTELTDIEKGKIAAYVDSGLSLREIARRLNRSAKVVQNFVRLGENYGSNKRSGRPKVLTPRQERRCFALATNDNFSTREIQSELGSVSNMTVWRSLKNNKNVKFMKKISKPPLSDEHKSQRLTFAKSVLTWSKEWTNVIFSDEKKFNLDGPDGYSYYWHDLWKEDQIFSKRQNGGGGVMVWSAFSHSGTTSLAFSTSTTKKRKCDRLLIN